MWEKIKTHTGTMGDCEGEREREREKKILPSTVARDPARGFSVSSVESCSRTYAERCEIIGTHSTGYGSS